MKRIFRRPLGGALTRKEKLLDILLDGNKHSTSELVRRVGHTFFVAKWVLVRRDGYAIQKEKHPTRVYEYNYWLVPPSERPVMRRSRAPQNLPVERRTRSFAPVAL